MRLVIAVLVSLATGIFLYSKNTADFSNTDNIEIMHTGEPRRISVNGLSALQKIHDNVVVLDTRAPFDYWEKHIEDSINMPANTLNIISLTNVLSNKNIHVIVQCALDTCDNANRALKMLTIAGYNNIYYYREGVQSWERHGFAVASIHN